jgi:hypothetical protein
MLVTALAWPVREALRTNGTGSSPSDTSDDTGPAHP